jgi:hypothetical protein
VQKAVWRGFDEMYSYVQAVTRASPDEMHRFVANGLVILVGAAIDMPAADRPWARGLIEACSPARAAQPEQGGSIGHNAVRRLGRIPRTSNDS